MAFHPDIGIVPGLKIILGKDYKNYTDTLKSTGLELLSERSERRCLQFVLKCLVHPIHQIMFPGNLQLADSHRIRTHEHFLVNIAWTDSYRMSAILCLFG